jgi:HD domain
MFALSCAVPVDVATIAMGKRIAGVTVPDTKLAREATDIARSTELPEIFNHSLRTYLFAELIAKAKNISHDIEIVYIASILHDTGLSPVHMSPRYPFEVDGANIVKSLLRKHGVSQVRSDLAWDAVALHDNGGIAQHKQSEVMLVNAGVGADFGAYLDVLSRAAVADVLEAAPRTHFIEAFLGAAAAVAKHKPLAAAHSFVADVGYCKVPGFHIPSFCDEVRTDPFVGYYR